MEQLSVTPVDTLIVSIAVLYMGNLLTRRIRFLQTYSIPQAVTGGLLVSLAVLGLASFGGPKVVFDMTLRDAFLLAFFRLLPSPL